MSGSLILILGDQLSLIISSLKQGDQARDVVLMTEVMEEASYVPHHKKKIAFVFSPCAISPKSCARLVGRSIM
jgi:deoxyribodipyrimidine photolyase-related protein